MKLIFPILTTYQLISLDASAATAESRKHATTNEGKPNIVIILADDYGYGSAGCYGANPELL